MRTKQEITNEVKKHIDMNGTEGLLPQNISDGILRRMLMEADSFDGLIEKKVPPTALLLSIIKLEKELGQSHKEGRDISDEKMFEHFDNYIASIRKEDARRKGELVVTEDYFPTLENILILD